MDCVDNSGAVSDRVVTRSSGAGHVVIYRPGAGLRSNPLSPVICLTNGPITWVCVPGRDEEGSGWIPRLRSGTVPEFYCSQSQRFSRSISRLVTHRNSINMIYVHL